MRHLLRTLILLSCGLLAHAAPLAAQSVSDSADVATARQMLFQRSYADAIDVLTRPDSLTPAAAYWLGRAHQARGQHDRAVVAFEQADTTDVDVLTAWGRSLRHLGRTPDARARYAAAYARAPNRRDVAQPLAALYADTQQWTEVRNIYARLVDRAPENPVFLAQLAQAHQALGALGTAVRTFETALEHNPKNLSVAIKLSRLYQLLLVPEKARENALHAVRHHGQEASPWRRLGNVHLWQRAYGPAVIAFKNAVANGDSSAVTLSNLGAAWYSNGGPQSAQRWLRASYAKDSTRAVTAFYLGLAHKDLGAPDSALVYLKRAADGYGRTTMANVYEHIADAQRHLGNAPDAIAADRLSLGLNPKQPEVQFHLATTYDDDYRDPAPAIRAYTAFLEQSDVTADSSRVAHAKNRLRTLRERRFFNEDAPADSSGRADSSRAVPSLQTPPDTLPGKQ